MNVGQILETHLGWACAGLGKQVRQALDVLRARRRQEGRSRRSCRKSTAPARNCRRTEDELRELAHNIEKGVPVATPVFDGAKDADIRAMLKQAGFSETGQVHAARRPDRRDVQAPGHRRLHLHAEAAPPGGRQDPRALDRPVLARHPAAAGRQGAVRRSALRRNGSVGARSLRRRLHAAGNADGEVRRRRRPHQGLRGDHARRRHVRGRHSRKLQRAGQGNAFARPQRRTG